MASWRSLMNAATTAARDLTTRAVVARRVLTQTGMVAAARPAGLRALVRGGGSVNPSLLLRYHAANTPHRTALIYGQRRESFFTLDQEIDKVAYGLLRAGITPGDKVLLVLRNVPELLIAQAGVARLGGAAVLVSWRSTADELRYLLKDSGARAVFCHGDAAEGAAAAASAAGLGAARCYAVGDTAPAGMTSYQQLAEQSPPAPLSPPSSDGQAAVVIYTSGTTGKPKGAVRRFKRDMATSVLGFLGETPMREGQVHLAVCPLYHSTAFGFVSLSYILGATVVLLDRFEPHAVLAALAQHRVDHTALVPTMLHRLVSLPRKDIDGYELGALKAIFTGGAPLPKTLALRVLDTFGDKLFQFYGATETGLVTLAKPADLRAAPGSIGKALPGNDIRLLCADGTEAAVNEVGELYVRSGNVVDGYHNNLKAGAAAMRDGYFSVGDLARRDDEGRYFIEGRKRDMIISGGVNVYPREVEEVLGSHPQVEEVAVVGLPSEEWGEEVHAFVVPTGETQPDALRAGLQAWARERLSGPKRPRGYTFLSALPRNPTGKVLKRQLVADAAKNDRSQF